MSTTEQHPEYMSQEERDAIMNEVHEHEQLCYDSYAEQEINFVREQDEYWAEHEITRESVLADYEREQAEIMCQTDLLDEDK